MKITNRIRNWLFKTKKPEAELEIVERCGLPPLYIVWDPAQKRTATFDTFYEVLQYSKRMGWRLV